MARKSRRVDWSAKSQALFESMRLSFMRANKRMLRVERYSDPSNIHGAHREKYHKEAGSMKDYAYRLAQKAIASITGKKGNNLRFKEKFKASKDQEQAKVQYYDLLKQKKAAEAFLSSASSTLRSVGEKKGLLDIYDKRTETINKRYVSDYGMEGFTPSELSKFFQSKKFDKLKMQYGSTQMFMIAASVKQIPTNKRDLADYLAHHIDLDELTAKDLKDADILSKDQALDILTDAKKISDLRKLLRFVDFTGSDLLNEYIADAIQDLKLSNKNLF